MRGTSEKKDRPVEETGGETARILSFFCLAGYLCVDFIPDLDRFVDIIHPRWCYLSCLTLVYYVSVMFSKDQFQSAFSFLFRNVMVRIFLLFILFSAISLVHAVNLPEGLIALGRIVLTFFMFALMTAFIYKLRDRFSALAKLIMLFLLFQSVFGLFELFSHAENISLEKLFHTIIDTFANKNIMAVTLLIKIPFVLFVLYSCQNRIWKAVSILTLLFSISLVLILNARSAYVGLVLLLFAHILFRSYDHGTSGNGRLSAGKLITLIIIVLFSLATAEITLTGFSDRTGYGTVFERFRSINAQNSSGRIQLWQEGFNLLKDNLILGTGEGNFKINMPKYWNKHLRDSLKYPRRLHNDFLENAVETGIFGGLCYLAVFFFALCCFIRVISGKSPAPRKELALLSFLGGVVYTVDAFFNFPQERSGMQVYFALLLALNIVSAAPPDKKTVVREKQKLSPAHWLPVFGLLLGIGYINLQVLKSSAFQHRYHLDRAALRQQADHVAKHFPDFPSIDFTGQPVRAIKAIYYLNEKRGTEALAVLSRGKNPSPWYLMENHLKVRIFIAMGDLDRARAQAENGNRKVPLFYPFVSQIIQISLQENNPATALAAVNKYLEINPWHMPAWAHYLELLSLQTKDFSAATREIDRCSWCSPEDKQRLRRLLSYLYSIPDKKKRRTALDEFIQSKKIPTEKPLYR